VRFLQLEGENPMEIRLRIDNKIKELYPDIIKNRVRVHCDYDEHQSIWQVQFKKGKYVFKTLLEKGDVDLLLSGQNCLSLTIELQQFLESIVMLESHLN
jgi:hypothetical protein